MLPLEPTRAKGPHRLSKPYRFVQRCFYIVSIWYAWHLDTGCRRPGIHVEFINVLTLPSQSDRLYAHVNTSGNSCQLHVCNKCNTLLRHHSLCYRTTSRHVRCMTSLHHVPNPSRHFPSKGLSSSSYSVNIQLHSLILANPLF